MKALDTNLLVRYLVGDEPGQARTVLGILDTAERKGQQLFVPAAVLLETLWVLDSAYGFNRDVVISVVENMLAMPVLAIENHQLFLMMCRSGRKNSTGLADLYIGLSARQAGCDTTLTFDKKAAKNDLFTLL